MPITNDPTVFVVKSDTLNASVNFGNQLQGRLFSFNPNGAPFSGTEVITTSANLDDNSGTAGFMDDKSNDDVSVNFQNQSGYSGTVSDLDFTFTMSQWVLILNDGTVLTQSDGTMIIGVLEDGTFYFDFEDSLMSQITSEIDTLSFGDGATQTNLPGYDPANFDAAYVAGEPQADGFVIVTDIVLDPNINFGSQLANTVVDINGNLTGGDSIGEITTGVFLDTNDDGLTSDLSSPQNPEDYQVNAGATLAGTTSQLQYSLNVTGYTIEFVDGTTLPSSGIGSMGLMVLEDGTVLFDFSDARLGTLSNSPEIARITFDSTVNQATFDGVVQNFFDDGYAPTCFLSGTMIETDRGEVPVEHLQVGDLVLTQDAGYEPICWIGSRRISHQNVLVHPEFTPIRIRAGALGDQLPKIDLIVSQQHRVLVSSKIVERIYMEREVLIAAKHLLELDGVELAEDIRDIVYYHFLFQDHQVVWANGAATESLYTGPQAIKSMPPASIAEIFSIFPELRTRSDDERPKAARKFLTGKQGRNLVKRHVKNNRPFEPPRVCRRPST